MDRLMLVSSDCHAGAPWRDYRPYVESRRRADFDAWLHQAEASQDLSSGIKIDPHGRTRRAQWNKEKAVQQGGVKGAWDAALRHRELDREGVAAEVMFPDGQSKNHQPFSAVSGVPTTPELRAAGARAYNRWLADFCSDSPERHAGMAAIPTLDIPAAVKEIQWARKAGLRGIVLSGMGLSAHEPEAFWHHPRYEPIWASAASLDMPVHLHLTGETTNYGADTPALRWINSAEIFWLSRRPTWFMIWGGVLERHPTLKFVNTEAGGSWVPNTLETLDYLWEVRNPDEARKVLPKPPSEYWRRQCYIGASPPSGRSDVEMRKTIGVGNLMWGSDYPHLEGTWPHSQERLKDMFHGVPAKDCRAILGETAINVYGLDRAKLRPIAQKIGPTLASVNAN